MSEREKPLPKPSVSAFGPWKFSEQEEGPTLMADRIAMAISEGRFEEFMKKEMPDNEYAGKLVSMMMGMTGMLSPENPEPEMREQEKPAAEQPPQDLRNAVDTADVKGVMEILRREHEKRSPGAIQPVDQEDQGRSSGQSAIERKILDDLVKIAADNSVTLDWLISRAIKLYVREYSTTGRL
jgi:hypothetical protein